MIRRFFRGILLLLLVACLSAGVAVGHFLISGGTPDTLRESLAKIATRGKSAATDFVKNPPPIIPNPVPSPASVPAPVLVEKPVPIESLPPSVAVYFAPCDPGTANGIDDAFLRFLRDARHSIAGAFYDLELPAAADVLVQKRIEGVSVRLVTDSEYQEEPALQQCLRAGIQVVFDNRSPFMHNKFCIVDDALVWTGSTNITENCMYRNNNNSIAIASTQMAQNFSAEFEEMFNLRKFGGPAKFGTPYPILEIDGAQFETYFAPDDHVAGQIISEIRDSRQSVDFMAFCFTSQDIAEAMAARMSEGVPVRGILDNTQAGSVFCQKDFLAERGAILVEDTNAATMHHKVIILDHSTVITGSYNFTKAADTKNDENVLIIHSAPIAAEYEQEFNRLFTR
jgi:phosphatidylserine/phosphatidylglycerophosphate/cardiolipin synthase-like enzyme